MTRLTDSELDALALRLWNAWTDDNGAFEGFAEVAREAAEWANEIDRERSADASRYRKAVALGLIRNELDKAEVDAILDASPDSVCA